MRGIKICLVSVNTDLRITQASTNYDGISASWWLACGLDTRFYCPKLSGLGS